MKIAYLGFDLFYPAFRWLCDHCEISGVYSCKTDGVYESSDRIRTLCKERSIPYTEERITMEDIDKLVELGCEMMISAGYYYLIPVDDRLRQVNIHPSLLPYGRGAWPMPLAILDRLEQSGVTFHKISEGFDEGDILLQKSFTLFEDDNLETFMEKAYRLLPDMLFELISETDALFENAAPQTEGVYQKEPDPEDYIIDEHSDFSYADRVLRAFYGFPVYYRDKDSVIQIVKGTAVRGDNRSKKLKVKGGYITALK